MEISFSSNSVTGDYIDTTFGTCHDSSAVVPCAKFCSDTFISIWMRGKWNFHHIWIVMEKLLVKWAPEPETNKSNLKQNYIPTQYSDIIMSAMASQITGVSIVCSTVCSGADQRKHQSSASLALVSESTGGIPSQRASNKKNAFI